MATFFQKIRENFITLLCVIFIAALAGLSWQSLSTSPYSNLQPKYAVTEGNPDYKDIIGFDPDRFDWQPYDYPALPPIPQGTKTVYLTWEIPETIPLFVNHILFATANQDAYVYLGNELIYMHGNWDDLTDTHGRTLHFLHINESLAGKQLTIMLHTGYANWLGSIDYFFIGSERSLIRKISLTDAIYIASLSIALSLIVFLVMDLVWRGIDRQRTMQLYLIAFLVSFILWTTGTSSFFSRMLSMPALWWEIHLMMLYIMPITFAKVIQEIVAPAYTKHIQNAIIIYMVVFVTATITEILGLDGYMNLLYLFYPILLVSCLVLIHTLLRSDWQQYPACRYGSVAMISLTIFVGIDALHFEYHRLAGILSMTIFSIYAVIPFVFFLIREQMLTDARLAQQNETLSKELQESQDEAVRDFLTGAYNRHQLEDGIANYSALANERGFAFSFAIFDVDHFKSVNDTRGHLGGDKVLRQIADTIHARIDRRHIFIRYGGDEFILLALHHDLAQMVAFCEELRKTLEATLGGVTLSFGVSTWHGADDRMSALMERADRALYLSKEKGRNAVSGEDEFLEKPKQ
ncbi:GGDEF/response regulator receiver domain protein [Centipeda periodontii DSM 2778]|uniref:GGDEF/response regulator receiver domain protein n=1 Tax=Centipeda periodontii DSM 2778 TaxID=888060 RepID=F5RJX3_9FIRM|nr:GGDEF domain-containing protein [Centipeda periodontii]EGK61416.1 GGDEF/response regulator receiver domain protein [Centipeda periodontii DSM 2778]